MKGFSLTAAVHRLVERTPFCVWLEDAPVGGLQQLARGRLFLDPLDTLEARTGEELSELLRRLDEARSAGLYVAGYMGYECGYLLEPKVGPVPQAAADAPALAWFGVYRECFILDAASGSFAGADAGSTEALLARLQQFAVDEPGKESAFGEAPAQESEPRFSLSPEAHARVVKAIHGYIAAGDVYQLNFTAPFRFQMEGQSAAALYGRLRREQPAAYSAFLHAGRGHRILSLSPELFFKVERESSSESETSSESGAVETKAARERICTRPMKGTVGRGRTTVEDQQQAAWLTQDEKNCAENLMIVDLLRNDVGRIAEVGSVRVEELFAVERHPTLWQMTSTVSARLRPGVGLAEVFGALFPCGSITGAPKVRAMQLIHELEEQPRGVYCGSIGFAGPRKAVFNVAIRTVELQEKLPAQPYDQPHSARMGVGGGIVIDSDAEGEFDECLLKAGFLTRRRPSFQLLESLLWSPAMGVGGQACGLPLLQLHLDRIEDSADYFSFAFNRGQVEDLLLQFALQLGRAADGPMDAAAHKLRLLLRMDGSSLLESEPVAGQVFDAERLLANVSGPVVSVALAAERTDSADPFYYHKTTHRPLYNRVYRQAASAGLADVLFLNERGELAEGAISNVFLVHKGCWSTPPIGSGVLAGVARRFLLAAAPSSSMGVGVNIGVDSSVKDRVGGPVGVRVEEKILTEADLRSADAIYIANAIRGVRLARLV